MKRNFLIMFLSLFFFYSPAFSDDKYPDVLDERLYSEVETGDDFNNFNHHNFEPYQIYQLDNLKQGKDIKVIVHLIFFNRIFTTYSHGLFAYDNNKLLYWGSINDFLKSDDDFQRKIGEEVAEKILEDEAKMQAEYEKENNENN